MGRYRTILLVLICLAMVFTAVSCGGNTAPEQAVDSFMRDLQDGDRDRVADGLAPGTSMLLLLSADPVAQPGTTALLSFARSHLTYTLTGGEREGDAATVEVDVTVPDMTPLLQDYLREALLLTLVDSSGDLRAALQTLLAEKVDVFSSREPFETRTSHVVLSLEKVEDRWKISDAGNLEIAVIVGFEQMFGTSGPVS